jgi:ABC-type sugar transport system permease subunit
MTLSFVIIGEIWIWMYDPQHGVLNAFIRLLGGSGVHWLSDERIVTYSLILAGLWRQIPYVMILYLAGLKNIPQELVEASYVDGANWFQRFRYIIVPFLTPATVVAMTISIIDSLRAFDIVYIMTRGGPYGTSNVMANFMYIEAFHNYRMGYGSAIAVIQFALTFAFIAIYMRSVFIREARMESAHAC